ncbi:MAG: esterase family protein [Chitinophagaceae bacterium]|nr:MAG: esterase family protein [Chitinophagaceae bacterium]
MKKWILALSLLASLTSVAAEVDTVSIFSKAMNRSYRCVVIKPESYKKGKAMYPTVYLLHGLGGKYSDWVTKAPNLKLHADRNNVLVVCPDGAINSWYFDSPIDSSARFETYVSTEIPEYIDAHYRTVRARNARAITGLSMGGHGGLYLGYRQASTFGAAGSMSGALMVEMIKEPMYGVSKRLGDSTNTALYRQYSIFGILDTKPKDTLALIIDCGAEDFIVEMSRAAHKRLQELKIPHDYTERPGRHDWQYWNNAVQYQLLFFRNYFDRERK